MFEDIAGGNLENIFGGSIEKMASSALDQLESCLTSQEQTFVLLKRMYVGNKYLEQAQKLYKSLRLEHWNTETWVELMEAQPDLKKRFEACVERSNTMKTDLVRLDPLSAS